MAIQQDQKPALPPRPTEFSGCAKTPPSWLVALTRHPDKNHDHDFYISPALDDEYFAGIICKNCHKRFKLTISNESFVMGVQTCAANKENSIHHLHTKEATESHVYSHCCLCRLVVNVEIIEPVIEESVFHDLSKGRSPFQNENGISYYETIGCLTDIVNRILKDNEQRSLNVFGTSFSRKVGFDESSKAFLQKLGYTMEGESYRPPPLDDETDLRFKYVSEELDMKSLELNRSLSNPGIYIRPWKKLSSILGIQYKKHPTAYNSGPFDPSSHVTQQSYSTLGCTSDMDDSILVWAYNRAIEENPDKTPTYLQAVFDLSTDRKSEALEELLALERSKGKFSVGDVTDAYKEMEAERAASDEHLIEAYRSYISESPYKGPRLRDALSIIGKHRNSSRIESFLQEENHHHHYYHASTFNYFSETPVGLENIGNTCYLNSLLQYYFTIQSLRDAVLTSNSVSTNGLDQWESVTIGGRRVSKFEVERAQKFVTLLSNLFYELMHSSQTSIAPNSDLAYLALVNAKNDEEQPPKESSRSPTDMQVDDLSPGPSSTHATNTSTFTDLIDINNNNSEMEETETVMLTGIAIPNDSSNNDAFQTADTFLNDDSSFMSSYKGKGRENNHSDGPTYGPDLPPDSYSDNKEDKLKKVSGMLFGKQQDVTECMDNVMFQLEAALKSPVDVGKQNIVKSLFYGNSKQILRYKEPNTGEIVEKIKEEPFNHLLVVVAEGRDLYDGLDVYFDTSTVDFDGTQAEREITLLTPPPILQIQVQRVQFDRSTSNIYKSNAYLRFEEKIYLDRYLDENRELLRDRISEAHSWKQEIDSLQEELKGLSRDKTTSLSIIDLLRSTAEFVQSMKNEDPEFISDENFDWRLSEVRRESEQVTSKINDSEFRIAELRSKLESQYTDLRQCEYRLHAVFIHSGQATFGHYWIYIYDFEKFRWLKYNDSYVTEVDRREVFADTTGSSANPYCMVYVRAQDAHQLVATVCRKSNI